MRIRRDSEKWPGSTAQYVHEVFDSIEERNKRNRKWASRIRAFANKCREDQPPPDHESLTNYEREMQRVYEEKLDLNRPRPGRDLPVAICSMPLIAIAVAQRLWPRVDDQTVLLTPEEEARWNEMYPLLNRPFEWYELFQWRIDDSPKREFLSIGDRTLFMWDEKDLREGESPWLVSVGRNYGHVAGWSNTELWSWNGRQANFIKTVLNGIS